MLLYLACPCAFIYKTVLLSFFNLFIAFVFISVLYFCDLYSTVTKILSKYLNDEDDYNYYYI